MKHNISYDTTTTKFDVRPIELYGKIFHAKRNSNAKQLKQCVDLFNALTLPNAFVGMYNDELHLVIITNNVTHFIHNSSFYEIIMTSDFVWQLITPENRYRIVKDRSGKYLKIADSNMFVY